MAPNVNLIQIEFDGNFNNLLGRWEVFNNNRGYDIILLPLDPESGFEDQQCFTLNFWRLHYFIESDQHLKLYYLISLKVEFESRNRFVSSL